MTDYLTDWPGLAVRIALDGRIMHELSPEFAALLKRTPEQLINTSLDNVLTAASRLYYLSAIDIKLRQRQNCEQQTLYLNTAQGCRPFIVSAHPQDNDTALLILMQADQHLALQQQLIQERKYTESLNRELSRREQHLLNERNKQKALLEKLENTNYELLQTEKLAALGQLSAGIAHEINNPVGYIQSNLNSLSHYVEKLLKVLTDNAEGLLKQRLQQENFEFIAADLLDLLQESQQGVAHITSITSALTQFARAPGNGEQCNVHEQINTTLRVLHNEIKNKARIQRDFNGSPLNIACDPAQFNQVMMNLLVNALQAINRFGQITIRTGVVEQCVYIEVADNGEGMSEETRKRALEPFYTTKPEGEGTGLGLALVYNIVRRHLGKLTIDSDVGKGTCIGVWFPLAQECNHGKQLE